MLGEVRSKDFERLGGIYNNRTAAACNTNHRAFSGLGCNFPTNS